MITNTISCGFFYIGNCFHIIANIFYVSLNTCKLRIHINLTLKSYMYYIYQHDKHIVKWNLWRISKNSDFCHLKCNKIHCYRTKSVSTYWRISHITLCFHSSLKSFKNNMQTTFIYLKHALYDGNGRM